MIPTSPLDRNSKVTFSETHPLNFAQLYYSVAEENRISSKPCCTANAHGQDSLLVSISASKGMLLGRCQNVSTASCWEGQEPMCYVWPRESVFLCEKESVCVRVCVILRVSGCMLVYAYLLLKKQLQSILGSLSLSLCLKIQQSCRGWLYVMNESCHRRVLSHTNESGPDPWMIHVQGHVEGAMSQESCQT